tara:strand:- start:931 stop:1416 length:486 start_codon:yes stop_codon:yes gene_type:complete
MIHVIDDVLSKRKFGQFEKEIVKLDKGSGIDQLYQYDKIKFAHPILKIASRHYDLKKCCGYEIWQHDHIDGYLAWHHDRDEILYTRKKIMNHPVCGIVFYVAVDKNLNGGGLLFENNERVSPKKNRLVLFDAKLKHCVEQYTGRRHSVNINPWNEKYQPFF